jgi:uncharacterized protein YbaA (DUF1428 family)
MPKYVDGYLLAVPKKKLQAYRRLAQKAGKVWRKHGALEYVECAGDDHTPTMGGFKIATFPRTMKIKPGETVIFSFIVYKSRAHRDRVNAKVFQDPLMSSPEVKEMPFDMKRMVYGGFKAIVEQQSRM